MLRSSCKRSEKREDVVSTQHGDVSPVSRALYVHHVAAAGQALTAQLIRKRVHRAFRHYGIKARSTHILRQTWATWTHCRGVDLKLIADLPGQPGYLNKDVEKVIMPGKLRDGFLCGTSS